MTVPRPRVRLLVCGTADRGDDGAGLIAAATLLPVLDDAQRAVLEVRRCGQLDVDDLLDVADDETALIVDAALGLRPGEIVVLPLESLVGDPSLPAPRSSHALPIGQALALADALGHRPTGSFVGIGGRRFGFGQSLSRAVRAAMPAFRATIATEIDRLAATPRIAPRS